MKATPRRGRRRDHRHHRGNSTIRSLLTMTITTSLSLLPFLLMQLLSFGIYLHPLVSSPVPSSSHERPPPPAASWSSGGMSGEGSPTTTARRSGGGGGSVLITDPRPQLDEIHLMSDDNRDVNPPPPPGGHPWTEAWFNDYWGRPLDSTSSHKSWRPLSVWSFRFGGGGILGRRAVGKLAGAVASMMASSRWRTTAAGGDDGDDERDGGRAGGREEAPPASSSKLFVHRFVNVCIHASIVRLVGIVATLLFRRHDDDDDDDEDSDSCSHVEDHDDDDPRPRRRPSSSSPLLVACTSYFSQILFAIHPAHVEAVANAANRPHVLALLFDAVVCDPDTPFAAAAVLGMAGLLSCETAIFHYPAMALTMTAIRYRELSTTSTMMVEEETGTKTGGDDGASSDAVGTTATTARRRPADSAVLVRTMIELLPRYILLLLTSATYLVYRIRNDTLSIPVGLIRPAENPYYDNVYKRRWTLTARIANYSYVLGLHVAKSFGVEIVGYSHEYGYDCIPEMRMDPIDVRLILPASIVVLLVAMLAWSWRGGGGPSRGDGGGRMRGGGWGEGRTHRVLLCLVFLSWMATLFPIAGILKVGTFVSDRIVVASTFSTCIFVGRAFALCIAGDGGGVDDDADDDETTMEENPEGDEGGVGRTSDGPSSGRLRATTETTTKTTSTATKSTIRKNAILLLFVLCVCNLARRTHRRSSEWMDSVPLLESSLRACPRSIKSNLEMSKIYSGLVPHMLDLERAL